MADETEPVVCGVADGVATLELNRPAAGNALDLEVGQALEAALDEVGPDPAVRCVLLLGRGPMFCGGGDVASMAAAPDRRRFVRELADAAHRVVTRLDALDRPVVAGVQGAAAGAGLALTLSADVVVAGESARLLTAYAGIGLTPDCGTSWLLPRTVGLRRALDLALTGRVLTAREALDWGLVSRVCADDAVRADATALAQALAAGPATALGRTRRLLRDGYARSLPEQLDAEADTISRTSEGEESAALIEAFLTRRR